MCIFFTTQFLTLYWWKTNHVMALEYCPIATWQRIRGGSDVRNGNSNSWWFGCNSGSSGCSGSKRLQGSRGGTISITSGSGGVGHGSGALGRRWHDWDVLNHGKRWQFWRTQHFFGSKIYHSNVETYLVFCTEFLTVDTASSNTSPRSTHFSKEIVSWHPSSHYDEDIFTEVFGLKVWLGDNGEVRIWYVFAYMCS